MQVYANDLNPASFHYLCTNIRLNHAAGKVLPFNLDGREFMRAAAAGRLDLPAAAAVIPSSGELGKRRRQPGQQQQQQQQQGPEAEAKVQPAPAGVTPAAGPEGSGSGSGVFHHVVMNLPAAAVDFLDALHGAFCPRLWQGQPLPLVHVYTFAKGQEELEGEPCCLLFACGCACPCRVHIAPAFDCSNRRSIDIVRFTNPQCSQRAGEGSALPWLPADRLLSLLAM
jgi:tRNA (guanine37-N1)-methyltransferase